jgi:MFS transporter, FSR family, fosmidomycin resistance protein
MGQMPSFGFLIVLVALAGLGSGFFHPAGAAYVSQYSPPSRRGLWASWFSAGGTAGMALGPIFATRLGLPNLHWAMPLGIVLGAICYVLTPSAKSERKSSGVSEYLEVFRGPMVKLWGMAVLRTLASMAYVSLLPFILKSKGYGDGTVATALVLIALGTALGGIVGGRISDKIGRIPVLRSSIALVIPFYVALILSDPSRVWFYPLAFVVSAVINASIPVGVVTAQEYAPKQVALASSIMMGFSWGTAGVLYWFVGLLADAIGPIQASLWSVALLLPSIWLASQLPDPRGGAARG